VDLLEKFNVENHFILRVSKTLNFLGECCLISAYWYKVFYEIQEIMEEDAPGVFLFSDPNIVAVNKRVKNYEMQGGIHGAYLSLWKVYIEE